MTDLRITPRALTDRWRPEQPFPVRQTRKKLLTFPEIGARTHRRPALSCNMSACPSSASAFRCCPLRTILRSPTARCNRRSASSGSSCECLRHSRFDPNVLSGRRDRRCSGGLCGRIRRPPPSDAPPASEHDRLGVARAATRAHCAVENRRKLCRGAVDGRGRELFTAGPAASEYALGASLGDRARVSIRQLRPFLSVLA